MYNILQHAVLQVLWLLGVVGALYVTSQHPEQALPLTVAAEPWTIWCVGPAAAAVTGETPSQLLLLVAR